MDSTNDSTNPVLHSFAYCLDFLREQVADVAIADMVAQPGGIMNHPAWVVGHLTHACQMLGGVLGLQEWLPPTWARRYGTGSVPVADASVYETKDDVLSILGDAQRRIIVAFAQLDEARLNAAFPDPSYRDVFPTVRHALTQVLVGHTANHIGQLSVWRRAMGLPPMKRPFE
ncbi:MAG TPA: DinB family protein [Blastocatellia bacterium]|nr:DinB family protein [Blastocatellia bacterium]